MGSVERLNNSVNIRLLASRLVGLGGAWWSVVLSSNRYSFPRSVTLLNRMTVFP